MPTRAKAAPKKRPAKPAAKRSGAAKKAAATSTRKAGSSASVAARPAQMAAPMTAALTKAPAPAKPPPRPQSAGQVATAQQAEERRKAATRKLFARIRSLEAILGADLRKRGSLLLSQAVDQWYAEATSTTATDVTITNAARAVISQL